MIVSSISAPTTVILRSDLMMAFQESRSATHVKGRLIYMRTNHSYYLL
jgi:hypothetical protein